MTPEHSIISFIQEINPSSFYDERIRKCLKALRVATERLYFISKYVGYYGLPHSPEAHDAQSTLRIMAGILEGSYE